uniref:Protein kinase domain-containing protein n=1 Tax=Setaria italica TaxID=4555 RepID=K3XFP5_SETIT
MAMSSASFHHSVTFQAFTVLCVLAALVAEVGGRHHPRHQCPPFSCSGLTKVSPPFRRQGDPAWCGVPSYELNCSDTMATIQINTGTYHVVHVDYTNTPETLRQPSFRVVDANLDLHSSCPLPRGDQLPYLYGRQWSDGHGVDLVLAPAESVVWATFLNCSQDVRNGNDSYIPVDCLTTNSSFVYVLLRNTWPSYVRDLEASCGYLATIPLGDRPENASFADFVRLMRYGFDVQFPVVRDSEYITWGTIILDETYGFVLAPLVALVFLAYKFWKTRITIDAVEKFLLMLQMLGPIRYAYTDITAITSHFKDKLGQGGYGSVYKGVLLPGDVRVAVKMLGASNCNGEDFISEVATIGRIHHVNIVRLMGFCSEEMRRALVYEYMPRGSLDKYIFSSEKCFSWDKLNEIALGIARGINYLHQGCDMQILHFDIKPHNILLDNNFVPKVADFGLAKLYPRDSNFVPKSAIGGTMGYIAPEIVCRGFGVISSKSDVYSFGMLLLEMAGGRRNADPNAANSSQAYYPSWVYSRLTQQEVGEISDTIDMHDLEKKLCIVGLWCIQMRPHDRPAMNQVIEMLDGGVDDLEMPPRPFFWDDDERTPAAGSYYLSSELNTIEEDE